MKILFLSQLFPYPLDSGAKIKTYQALRFLSQQHRITLLTFIRNERERSYLAELKNICHEVKTCDLRRSHVRDAITIASAFFTGQSAIVKRDYLPQMQALVEETLANHEFDVIHVDRLQMAQYVPAHPAATLVLDQHNVESEIIGHLAGSAAGLKKRLLKLEYRNLRRFEGRAGARFQHIICVSENDRCQLQTLINEAGSDSPASPAMHVVPIGVDCAAIRPLNIAKEPGRLLFLGPLNWPPNAEAVMWFAREILPAIRRQCPQAKLRVVGDRAPRQLRKMALTAGIEMVGYVADILPELAAAQVMVVPLRAGSGLRVKILTAMAAGLTVVSTPVGYSGICAAPNEQLLVADTADEFAAAVISLLNDPNLRNRLEKAGRRLAETEYDLPVVNRELAAVYDAIETRHTMFMTGK